MCVCVNNLDRWTEEAVIFTGEDVAWHSAECAGSDTVESHRGKVCLAHTLTNLECALSVSLLFMHLADALV